MKKKVKVLLGERKGELEEEDLLVQTNLKRITSDCRNLKQK